MKYLHIVSALCLALCLMACATSNAAPAPPPLPSAGGTPTPAPAAADPLSQLATFTIADLQAADADAVANGDAIAHACYPALIAFIQSLPNANSGTTVSGAFSAFQKARDFRNRVNQGVPTSLLMGCGPLVTQVRGDILVLLGRLGVGGVTGAAVLGPLVP